MGPCAAEGPNPASRRWLCARAALPSLAQLPTRPPLRRPCIGARGETASVGIPESAYAGSIASAIVASRSNIARAPASSSAVSAALNVSAFIAPLNPAHSAG